MCGFAAPKIDTVRIGFIGMGNRDPGAVERMIHIEGVEIKALCDIREEKVNAVKKALEGSMHKPDIYTGKEYEWKKLCERKDIDLVYIATPWALHTPMAVYAMGQGKHVCVEVPAAKTIEECWQLVTTSERTRRHCVMGLILTVDGLGEALGPMLAGGLRDRTGSYAMGFTALIV